MAAQPERSGEPACGAQRFRLQRANILLKAGERRCEIGKSSAYPGLPGKGDLAFNSGAEGTFSAAVLHGERSTAN